MDACEETLTALLDEREGRSLPGRREAVAAHARGCPACARALAEWPTAIPMLRDLTDAPLADTSLRRMENAILATLARPAPRPRARRGWIPLAMAAGMVLVLGLSWLARLPPTLPLASLQSQWGDVTRAGQPLRNGEALRPGDILTVPADGEASLAVGRAVDGRVVGPARLILEGDAAHPHLRLDAGRLFVRVAKRQPGETLRVQTGHGHVEVRGTRFVVGYEGARSYVTVEEGEVAAFRVASPTATPVRAGETFWLAPAAVPASPGEAPPVAPPVSPSPPTFAPTPETAPPAPDPGPTCEDRVLAARKAMRADRPHKALAVIAGALDAREGRAPTRCQDELGYLRAEALRQAGATEQAINAFLSLDRPNATPAMRQNALYAAGQLEARRGRWRPASRLFDSAFAAHPDGALAEEALAASLDAHPRAGGDATAIARRYLDRFPTGVAAARARHIVGIPSP